MARGALVLGADGTDAGVQGVTASVSAFKQQAAAQAPTEEQLPSSSLASEDSTWRPAGGKAVPCMAEELELQVEDLQSLWHESEAVSLYSGQCVGSRRAMRQAGLQPSWTGGGDGVRKPVSTGVPSHSKDDGCWAGGYERPSSPALLVVPKAAAQLQPVPRGTWVSPLERLPLPRPGSLLRSRRGRSRSSTSTDAEDDDVPLLISGTPAAERLLNSVSMSPPPPPASAPVDGVPQSSQSPEPQARQQGALDSEHHIRRRSPHLAPQDGHDCNDSHGSEQSARLLSWRQESDSSSDELESEAIIAIAPKPSMHRPLNTAGSTKRQADEPAGNRPCDGAEAMVAPGKIPRSSSAASITHCGTGPGAAAGGYTGPAGKRRATSARATAAALAKQRKRSGGGRGTGPLAPTMPGQCCSICHTQATPVWRAGPLGPKTLCNACGVRYMKTVKPRR